MPFFRIETEAVLVACEGSAEGAWGGFGAEAAILGHVPAEVKQQLFSRARRQQTSHQMCMGHQANSLSYSLSFLPLIPILDIEELKLRGFNYPCLIGAEVRCSHISCEG